MKLYLKMTLATAALVIVACAQTAKKSTTADSSIENSGEATWAARMNELRITLMDLGPYLFDDQKFNDPANFGEIKKQVKRFQSFAHDLDQSQKGKVAAPSSDPALAYLAGEFRENMNRASESLDTGNREYARSVLKTSLSYCISCHTRSDVGPKFPLFDNPTFVSSLRPMEQANYYVATRQFDAAFKKYMDILKDPSTGKQRPFDIERASRKALAIAVRVNNNPKEALRIAKYVSEKEETPLFVKNDSLAWIQEIEEWQKDMKNPPQTEAQYLLKIRNLLKKGDQVQRYRTDMRGDIHYLQATMLVHKYFDTFGIKSAPGEILYLAGRSYEPLQELGIWTLHEIYYEQCIRKAPHSTFSRKCYENLEQSILLGYSGSAGIFLPLSVQKQLRELYSLSLP